MQMMLRFFFGALALGLAGGAIAQDGLPPLRTVGSISYITGGIGLDESSAIKAAEKEFSLSLLFVETKRGEYLADVKVGIMDQAGTPLLETVSDGPMLLARLPAGVYRISAEYGGSALWKTVRVDAKGVTRTAFVWRPTAKAIID